MENNRIVDFSKTSLHDIYGENCFNDAIMRELLPKAVYKELKEVQQGNKELQYFFVLGELLYAREPSYAPYKIQCAYYAGYSNRGYN